MEHKRFVARRRARFDGIDGKVNIPYGTALTCQDGFLTHENQRVCAVGSQNGTTLCRMMTVTAPCAGSW